jgi:DNA-binding MarR family transcriptional regulator
MVTSPGLAAPPTEVELSMLEFVDAYDRAYEIAAAEHDLSVAQACLLARISQPRGMSDLADELSCDPSNITQIAARLDARNLIERRTDTEDARFRLLSRTPAGDALYAEFEKSFEFARSASSNLSAHERDQLSHLLRKALGHAD